MNENSRWLFTKEQIINTPSRKYNIDFDREIKYRQIASCFIQDLGQSLRVKQLCINTAIVYMHRFFMFHSMTKFDRYKIGLACLYLSSKTEEIPQKIDVVINKAYKFLYKKDGSDTPSIERYNKMHDDLLFHENVLLMTLGFDVVVSHPHPIILQACELIKANKELQTTSYFLASNSLHLTTMCLEYRPSIVACLCIYFASKWLCYEIQLSAFGKPWYSYIDPEVTLEFLENLTNDFLSIFEECRTKLKNKIEQLSGIKPRVSFDKHSNSHNHVKQLKQVESKEKPKNENEAERKPLELCLSIPKSVLSPESLFSEEKLVNLQEPIKPKEEPINCTNPEKVSPLVDSPNSENPLKRKRSFEENSPRKRFCVSNENDQEVQMRINISTILKASLSQNALKSIGISDATSASNLPQINAENSKMNDSTMVLRETMSNRQSNGFQFSNHQSINVDFANRQSKGFQFSNLPLNGIPISNLESKGPHFSNVQSNDVQFLNFPSKEAQFSNIQSNDVRFSNHQSNGANFSNHQSNVFKFSNLESNGVENWKHHSNGDQLLSNDENEKPKFSNNETNVKNLVQVPSTNSLISTTETLISTTTVDSEKESDIYINVTDIFDTAVDTPQIVPNKVNESDMNNNNEEYEKKQHKSKKDKKEKTDKKKRSNEKQKKERVQEEGKNCDTKTRKLSSVNNRPVSPIIISIPKEKLHLSDNLLSSGNKVKPVPKPSLKIKIPKKLILDTKLNSPSTNETVQTSLNLQINHDVYNRNKNDMTWMTQHRLQPVYNGY